MLLLDVICVISATAFLIGVTWSAMDEDKVRELYRNEEWLMLVDELIMPILTGIFFTTLLLISVVVFIGIYYLFNL